MKKKTILLYLILFITGFVTHTHAQRISRVNYGLDVGMGYAPGMYAPSLNYYQNLTFGGFKYVGIGWTGRFAGNIFGDNPVLKTVENPGPEDQISLKRIAVYDAAFGLTLNFNFRVIELGGNIDLVNIAMGKTSKVLYKIADLRTATDSSAQFNNELVTAYPQMANALPIATKKSNGQSEAYLRIWFNQEIGLKLGYRLQNVVYRTEHPLNNAQNRFVNRYGMPFAALSFYIQN